MLTLLFSEKFMTFKVTDKIKLLTLVYARNMRRQTAIVYGVRIITEFHISKMLI